MKSRKPFGSISIWGSETWRSSRVLRRIYTSLLGVPAARSFEVTLIRYLVACSLGDSMFATERSLSVFTDLTKPNDFFMLLKNLPSYFDILVLAVNKRVIN